MVYLKQDKKMSNMETSYSFHSVIIPANHVFIEFVINEGCILLKILILTYIYFLVRWRSWSVLKDPMTFCSEYTIWVRPKQLKYQPTLIPHNISWLVITITYISIIDNYSLKWRWLVVDIYRAAKWRGNCLQLATNNEVNSCFSMY